MIFKFPNLHVTNFQFFKLSICNFQTFNFQTPIFNFSISTSPTFQTFKFSSFQMSKFQNFQVFNCQHFKKVRYAYLPNLSQFQVPRYENNIFKDAPTNFLVFLKSFGDKYRVRGSIFCNIFGRPRNHPKNLAIDQES